MPVIRHPCAMAADTPLFGRLPSPRDPLGSYRVCLVCLGNICRSPMAEVVLTDELARAGLAGQVQVDSAGTGDWHIGGPMDAGAAAELARRGYDGSAHRARLFDPAWFPGRDLVLAMDRRNLAQLRRMAPDAGSSAGWTRSRRGRPLRRRGSRSLRRRGRGLRPGARPGAGRRPGPGRRAGGVPGGPRTGAGRLMKAPAEPASGAEPEEAEPAERAAESAIAGR